MALFVAICIDVYIIIFKLKVITDEWTMVTKSILIYLIIDYNMYISFICVFGSWLYKMYEINENSEIEWVIPKNLQIHQQINQTVYLSTFLMGCSTEHFPS